MKPYIWIFILFIITILIYKFIYIKKIKEKKSSFWNNMPVMQFDKEYNVNKIVIDEKYGYLVPDQLDISLFKIDNDIDEILLFLNNNYIDGYTMSKDYIYRKMTLPGSIGIIYKSNNNILGFVQSSTFEFIGKVFSYVDLLCVSKEHRSKGLAKKLIDNIIYHSPNKIFIHKKDKYPLPFNHFYTTSHYSCGIAYLKNKYGLKKTLYNQLFKNDRDINNVKDNGIFLSSDSIKTYKYENNYISFSLHKFKAIGYLKIAEIFYISPNFKDYTDIIAIMNDNQVDFMVTLPNGLFKDKIDEDLYSKSMELYVYTFNFVLQPITEELWLNIP